MTKATPQSLIALFDSLTFASHRTPESTGLEASFRTVSEYRDGGIFVAHFAGQSEWERHPRGDELVMVIEGETTLFLLEAGVETPHVLKSGELLVVPQNHWHRFDSAQGVKLMTVTPQPTEHSVAFPD